MYCYPCTPPVYLDFLLIQFCYLVSTQCGTQQPLTQHILIPPNQIKSTLSGVLQCPPQRSSTGIVQQYPQVLALIPFITAWNVLVTSTLYPKQTNQVTIRASRKHLYRKDLPNKHLMWDSTHSHTTHTHTIQSNQIHTIWGITMF